MLSEALIQKKIIQLLKDGEFYGSIDEADIEKIELSVADNDNVLPSFSIDQYIRKRGAASANAALNSLGLLEILTSDENISNSKRQILRPDIVCINPETQTLVIFELKKSTQTERQALTELLAYEHEVKNILPFLSNYDTTFVLISTEWSVLLQHAAGSAIAWSNKNLLCLRLNLETEKPIFNVVRSDAWTITGTTHFPRHSVSSFTIYLYEIDPSVSDDEIKYRSSLALEMLSREADRAGLHGFVIASDDLKGFNDRGIFLTLCAVSPFSFFQHMLSNGQISVKDGRLIGKLSKVISENGHESGISSLLHVAKKFMYPILETFCDPMFENFVEWEYAKRELESRALPFEIEFWGLPGDYARSFVIDPAVNKHRSNIFPAGKTHWKAPNTGLLLINNLYEQPFLKDGRFRPSDAFRLGLTIGADAVLRETYKNGQGKGVECFKFWHNAEILYYLDELSLYVNDSNEVAAPSAPLEFNSSVGESVDWDKYIAWVFNDLFDGSKTHSYLFRLGLNMSVSLRAEDFTVRPGCNGFYTSEARSKLCGFLSAIISGAKKEVSLNEGEKKSALKRVADILNLKIDSNLTETLEGLSLEQVSYVISDVLILADLIVEALLHTFRGISPMDVDWDNLKQGIDSMYERGIKYPAVVLEANGLIGTASFDGIGYALLRPVVNSDVEVYVSDSSSGVQTFYLSTWEKLRSGELVANRKKSNS